MKTVKAMLCALWFSLLTMPIVALAQEKATRNTQATQGTGGAVVRELGSSWWMWAGVIGLVVFAVALVVAGVLVVVLATRKR